MRPKRNAPTIHNSQTSFRGEYEYGPSSAAAAAAGAAPPLPPEHLDEGDPEALGEAAVDQEVDRRVHDQEEMVHVACAAEKRMHCRLNCSMRHFCEMLEMAGT